MAVERRVVLAGIGGAAGLVVAGRELLAVPARATRVRPDLYHCEGCEAALERPPRSLGSVVRLAESGEPGERMLLSGRVVSADGATPMRDVVIYAHHTNQQGLYAGGDRSSRWSARHGRLRGWARTDAEGRYAFHTIKPAPYPDWTMPAHVHLFIAEPGRPPYYADDAVFAGEFGVTPDYRARQELRGGSGIVSLARTADGGWLARRDIRLEPHPA